MSDYKAGDHLLVKLSGGRIVEATVKAIVETTDGVLTDLSVADRHRGSLIVRSAPIVEERRVRRQAGDLPRSRHSIGIGIFQSTCRESVIGLFLPSQLWVKILHEPYV